MWSGYGTFHHFFGFVWQNKHITFEETCMVVRSITPRIYLNQTQWHGFLEIRDVELRLIHHSHMLGEYITPNSIILILNCKLISFIFLWLILSNEYINYYSKLQIIRCNILWFLTQVSPKMKIHCSHDLFKDLFASR